MWSQGLLNVCLASLCPLFTWFIISNLETTWECCVLEISCSYSSKYSPAWSYSFLICVQKNSVLHQLHTGRQPSFASSHPCPYMTLSAEISTSHVGVLCCSLQLLKDKQGSRTPPAPLSHPVALSLTGMRATFTTHREFFFCSTFTLAFAKRVLLSVLIWRIHFLYLILLLISEPVVQALCQ